MKSRHGDERAGWIEQKTASPNTPFKATQRAGFESVPSIANRCGVTGEVISSGTPCGLPAVDSAQWKETRKNAQHAPQAKHGFAAWMGTMGDVEISGMQRVARLPSRTAAQSKRGEIIQPRRAIKPGKGLGERPAGVASDEEKGKSSGAWKNDHWFELQAVRPSNPAWLLWGDSGS